MPSIAAYVRSDGVNSVVYMGNDFHIHEVALVPGHDWRAYDLTENSGAGLVGGDLAAYVRSDGVNAVLYSSLASSSPKVVPNYLYELSWKVGDKQWNARNLSQDAGVPAAWFPTNQVGFARSDGWNTVIFITEGDQGFFIIGELALAPGAAHWTAGNLEGSSNVTGIAACYYHNSGRTAVYVGSLTDADETPHIFQSPVYPFVGRLDRDLNLAVPAAALPFGIAKPACYVRSDGVTAVVYGGIDQDSIHELVYLPGGWQVGGQLATGVGPVQSPVCYVRSDGVNAIVYRGADKNIYELAGNSELNSLTKLFGAPLAASDPVCYVRSDKVNSVVYVGVDKLIHELYLIPGKDWQHGTLPTPVPSA